LPLATRAQQTLRSYRIGVLETISPTLNARNFEALRMGLRELGYVEGQNIVIEYRSADGRSERFQELAAELVRLKVDVIVTRGTSAVQAAKQATKMIPIVMAASGDPLGAGVVAALARPGENVTGLSAFTVELLGKRLELLKEVVTGLNRIAFLMNLSNPVSRSQWVEMQDDSRSLGVEPVLFDVRTPAEIERAFDKAVSERVGAMVVGNDTVTHANRPQIVALAAKYRLPVMYQAREFVDEGGLMAYGVSYPDLYRRAADYVDKLLKGAMPADLPVQQPTKFEMIVNLKSATSIGLIIPESFLLRADEVIE
ncbi:MAG: ABC transporter substrate-binding protein, partial [Xanthobacteraceae bacterium]